MFTFLNTVYQLNFPPGCSLNVSLLHHCLLIKLYPDCSLNVSLLNHCLSIKLSPGCSFSSYLPPWLFIQFLAFPLVFHSVLPFPLVVHSVLTFPPGCSFSSYLSEHLTKQRTRLGERPRWSTGVLLTLNTCPIMAIKFLQHNQRFTMYLKTHCDLYANKESIQTN